MPATRPTAPVASLAKSAHRFDPNRLLEEVQARMASGQRVRRTLPGGGRIHIDRPLPFLCIYRQPTEHADVGTHRLVKGEASYLVASAAPEDQAGLRLLVKGLAELLVAKFGALLLLEIWAGSDSAPGSDAADTGSPARFRVVVPFPQPELHGTVDVLANKLRPLRILKNEVSVEVEHAPCHPPGLRPLLTLKQAQGLGCHQIGLEVPPVYRDAATGIEFPLLMLRLRRRLGNALKHTFHHYASKHTRLESDHRHRLGRRAVVKTVWEVDGRLTKIERAFDFLLTVTPVNAIAAWSQFKRSRYTVPPAFYYRPRAFDPGELKRRLFSIPMHRVEDPVLQLLFLGKQQEIDRKISMMVDRDTPHFLYGSLQLHGPAEPELLALAEQLLQRIPPEKDLPKNKDAQVTAAEFVARAHKEFDRYRERYPDFFARAVVTDESTGILVSGDTLLVHRDVTLRSSRVEALLQHEVGTHLLTYFNGQNQRFSLLSCGLSGYEALQEGIAVLAEYLVGGLDPTRLRQLAARVIAVDQLVAGASFVDTYRTLAVDHGLPRRTAFYVTMRVYRGGGLTKDAVYLRGLGQVLGYLAEGGDYECLLSGKFALEHIPLMNELRLRGVVRDPAVLPRYLSNKAAQARLAALRETDGSVLSLLPSLS